MAHMRGTNGSILCPVLLAALFLLPGSLEAQDASSLSLEVRQFVTVDQPIFALTNVRVVDGMGTPPRDRQTIVVEHGRIVNMGATDEVRLPADVRIIDLSGHTVIPGIVGLHNHTDQDGVYKRQTSLVSAPLMFLGSGVTTARTAGSDAPYQELNLKRAIDAGDTPGPRIHFSGPRLREGMTHYSPESPEAARRLVRYWKEEGATTAKAHSQIKREYLGAAIDEAHRLGIPFTGHLCSVTLGEAVDLGIDALEHGLFPASDFVANKEPDVCPPNQLESLVNLDIRSSEVQALIRKIVDREVAIISTLSVLETLVPGRPVEDRVFEWMAPEVRELYRERVWARDQRSDSASARAWWENVLAFEKAFVDAGGLLTAGPGAARMGASPGFADQRNLELLVEAGFSPVEAIQIMTFNSAKFLGVDDELGSISVGKLADIVVIDGDPIANPADIRNVKIVFKDGVGYNSAKLLEAARGLVGIR